ncbi:MAG TPA: hypothetical protein PKY82_20510 [Pyrinomonadaceae bacterium]|nr:hypothetical protein [Pyrinomonadaceae bacterium]
MSANLVRIERWKCVCERCGYGKDKDWISASIEKPKTCPYCKSPYWENPRERIFKNKKEKR